MQGLGAYPQAGMGMAGEKSQAAGGMRSLRDDLWRRMAEFRERGMRHQIRDSKKDRKMMMMSAGLGGLGSIVPGLMPQGGPPPIQGGYGIAADDEIRRTLGLI